MPEIAQLMASEVRQEMQAMSTEASTSFAWCQWCVYGGRCIWHPSELSLSCQNLLAWAILQRSSWPGWCTQVPDPRRDERKAETEYPIMVLYDVRLAISLTL